jgi:hypothetical protein
MKWSDTRLVKAYLLLMAVVSLIVSVLADWKWGGG